MRKYQSRLNAPRQPGFTLIEPLVVISIIALLISILLPALQRVKRQARVLYCMSNLKSVGVGLTTYVTENKGKCPTPLRGPSLSFTPLILLPITVRT